MRTGVVAVVLALTGVSAALVSPGLERQMAATGERTPVSIVLREQAAPAMLLAAAADRCGADRRVAVARALREFSRASQEPLVQFLWSTGAANVTPLWIVNAVYCEATPELIAAAASRPEVWFIEADRQYAPGCLGEPAPATESVYGLAGSPKRATDEVPWGIGRIHAPDVWAQGLTGQNVVVAVITTGVNYNHYDLADHMWTVARYPHHGWDFENGDDDPMDEMGHGTFTAGVVASDGTGGSQCGVAPDAQVMALRVRTMADSISEMQCWRAMEFAVSPPLAERAGASVYVMPLGWILSWLPQQATWRQAVINTNAAGLVQVTSSGSERGTPPPSACRCPGNVPPPWWNPDNTGVGSLAGMVAAGGVDSSDVIASMSSPGPVTWMNVPPYNDFAYPPGLTKPELVAPAINIKSLALGGGYTVMSGTSWAAAFVGGAAALMLSKDSTLLPADVDSILEVTAVDLGPARKDNDYGAGRIDALAAVNHVGMAVAEKQENGELGRMKGGTVFARKALLLPLAPFASHASLFDPGGRKVADVNPGVSDLRHLAPGVYVLQSAGVRREAGLVKVVVLR